LLSSPNDFGTVPRMQAALAQKVTPEKNHISGLIIIIIMVYFIYAAQ
jgi:hypothetical protein